jgi:hypothetical protein
MTKATNHGDDVFADLLPAPKRRERARFELDLEFCDGRLPCTTSGRLRDLLATSKQYTADGLPVGKARGLADGVARIVIIRSGDIHVELERAGR